MERIGWLLRHGSTGLNDKGLARGSADVPLDAHGVLEAKRLAQALKGQDVGSITTDDMKRTTQTAAIIGHAIHVPVTHDRKLRTLDIGSLSGQPDDKVLPMVAKHIKDHPDTPLPDGESYNDYVRRVWPRVRQFLSDVRDGKHPVLVTHGRVTVLIAALVEGKAEHFDLRTLVSADAIQQPGTIFTLSYDNGWKLEGPMTPKGAPAPPR